jgi:hypothetical protein
VTHGRAQRLAVVVIALAVFACGHPERDPGATPPATAPGAVASGPKGRATAQLTITFDGGNAFVFQDEGRSVHVGAVAPEHPRVGSDPHAMSVTLEAGTHGGTGTYQEQPVSSLIANHSSWALRGYEIWVCPDRTCDAPPSLAVPAQSTPAVACQAESNMNNLFYAALLSGSRLARPHSGQ